MKRVNSVMIILGPPGPEEDRLKYEALSKRLGKPEDEIWFEVVHEAMGDWANRETPESLSVLDEMLSGVFGFNVRVNEPFMTHSVQGALRSPTLILYPNKIIAVNGDQIEIDWSALHKQIGSFFQYVFKTEWVRSVVIYEP